MTEVRVKNTQIIGGIEFGKSITSNNTTITGVCIKPMNVKYKKMTKQTTLCETDFTQE